MLTVAALLSACAGGSDGGDTLSYEALVESPDDHEGQRVTIEAGYFAAFEISVLTSGFAESYPPQPVEPLIWVAAGPPVECLEQADGGVRWAERVEASGVFRYDPERGFGHLGTYDMALEGARITCA